MKNKKNALGISALVIFFIFILLQGYSVAYFIVNSHNVYKYVSKEVTFSYIMLGIMQILYMVVLITWFVFFIYERKISRIPLIITFCYYVFRIIDNLIIHKITMGYYAKKGFLKEVYKDSWLKDNWTLIVIAIAWLTLIFGTKMISKIIFISIRGGLLLMNIFTLVRILIHNTKLSGIKITGMSIYYATIRITCFLSIVLFMLYLLKDDLFYKKSLEQVQKGGH